MLNEQKTETRRRRVRLSYPKPLVELALNLAACVGVSELAKQTDIPPSVIYRWRSQARETGQLPQVTDLRTLSSLLRRCAGMSGRFDSLLHLALRADQAPDALDERNVSNPNTVRPGNALADDRSSIDLKLPSLDVPATSRIAKLELARRLIHDNYFESINCARLAATAGMARTYFIRMFGKAFRMSPHQYLLRVRLAAAKELLARSTESIDVIAAGVGFRTGAALGRAFKRMEGKTVSEVHAFTSQGYDSQLQLRTSNEIG